MSSNDNDSCCCCLWPSLSQNHAYDEPLLHARVARENSFGELQRLQSFARGDSDDDLHSKFLGVPGNSADKNAEAIKNKHAKKRLTFNDIYSLEEQIGKGSTAVVFKCRKKNVNAIDKAFAVKIIDKKKVSVMYTDIYQQLKREVDILDSLRHPYIIRLHGMFESEKALHVVTEYAAGGELFDYLISRPNGLLSEAEASQLIRQITSAVAYMHMNNVLHRDIKLENILLADKPEEHNSCVLKIIDFGLAKTMKRSERAKTFFGTVGYLAPEMVSRRYSFGVDVWAIGVLTFVLLCGVFPFEDDVRKGAKVNYKLKFPPWAKNISASAKDLLKALLQVNPNARATAASAMDHPW
eukprot:CAMPEP_0204827046 /NCGR_PEP_ID=MMETSP1346-20131115/4613_1 /ASSEMBLY_ACC=CAM_ASM_000771 /TAXON_ID=215587 /ORGANISM="Aplanochytrium stocchinoi, Strain GSBS06" /LENGTH=352 /DNA_ID=CAMNT_0051955339 /DNA_START=103 /DNA_END=1158 /DNA_ORIENTATION=-